MGVIHEGKEKFENFLRKSRLKRKEQKKRPPKKAGKKQESFKLTIPSRRGRKK